MMKLLFTTRSADDARLLVLIIGGMSSGRERERFGIGFMEMCVCARLSISCGSYKFDSRHWVHSTRCKFLIPASNTTLCILPSDHHESASWSPCWWWSSPTIFFFFFWLMLAVLEFSSRVTRGSDLHSNLPFIPVVMVLLKPWSIDPIQSTLGGQEVDPLLLPATHFSITSWDHLPSSSSSSSSFSFRSFHSIWLILQKNDRVDCKNCWSFFLKNQTQDRWTQRKDGGYYPLLSLTSFFFRSSFLILVSEENVNVPRAVTQPRVSGVWSR